MVAGRNFIEAQCHRFEPLLDYMATAQADNHELLRKVFTLVNTDKHERELVPEDYSTEELDQNPDPANMITLAHRAATFVEQMVAKYLEYLKF